MRPRTYKLQSFVLSSTLAAVGGIVYMLLYNGSTLGVTQPTFTLTLLLMVVIGGAGSRWGAVLGGILYTYLNDRLTAIGSSSAVAGLPHAVRTPLEQPLFLLGVIFILIVVFLPGGLAGLVSHGRPTGLRRLEEAVRPGGSEGAPPSLRRRHDRGLAGRQHRVGVARRRAAAAARPGARLRPLGLGAAASSRSRPATASSSSTTAASATATSRRGRTRRRRWPATRWPVLDAAGVERAHVLGASLGGAVAQELALRHAERVDKLVLVATMSGMTNMHPMPAQTLQLMAEAPTLAPEVALRRFVENALAPEPDPALVDELFACGRRTRPIRPAGRRRPGWGGFDVWASCRRSRSRRSSCRARATRSSIRATRRCSRSGSRARGSSSSPGGHLLFWKRPDEFAELVKEFLQMTARTIDRRIRDRARTTPGRVAIDDGGRLDVRRARRRLRPVRRAFLEPGLSRATASRR